MSSNLTASARLVPVPGFASFSQVKSGIEGDPAGCCFFKAHPEFNGEVRVTVLADGQVLLSAKGSKRRASKRDEIDPIMLGFLQFLEKQMAKHPDMIAPVDCAQLARIGKLVEGIDVE